MKTVPERIAALRNAMLQAGVDAYIIPSSDPHASEYAPAHFNSWEWFTGFPCENSNFIITPDFAGLWVDGRFFGAADAALAGTGVTSMHDGANDVPRAGAWLATHLDGKTIGYCAACMPLAKLRAFQKATAAISLTWKPCTLEDEVWTEDRPALPATEAWLLDKQYAGKDAAEKLAIFREKLGSSDAAMLTELECIAWLLNLRAYDVESTPYALAFCYVSKKEAVLFINSARVPQQVQDTLAAAGVTFAGYDDAPAYLAAIKKPVRVQIDPNTLNCALYNTLDANPACTIVEGSNPIMLLKAVKNETELTCTRAAHIRDAAAMVRFQIELEKRLASDAPLRETDIDPILHKYRSANPGFVEESFGTIAAYGSNAAMMHYAPAVGSDAAIERKGFLLVDCGGTYLGGTTDITRTYPCGPLTDAECEFYTLTLRSHIDVAKQLWRSGSVGEQIDMAARAPFWNRMLDYRCGTGHGVSHVGAVHEGPHSLRPTNHVEFVPGMIVTDEPGYYEEGSMGIRIENEMECVTAGKSEYGTFLTFRPLMYVPISTVPVKLEMLLPDEIAWLNNYHAQVLEKVGPLLNEEELAWLKEKCAPIGV